MTVAGELIRGYAWFAICYFLLLNSIYLLLIVLAAVDAVTHAQRRPYGGRAEIFRSPLAPGISIVVPARNEEDSVVGSVHGMLNLRYPEFELVVVDDGSTDATFSRLQAAFDLVEVDKVIRHEVPALGRVRSVHAARAAGNLLVVRKESSGRPADAVNTGANTARYPLVCRVDADSYLDEDALLAVAQPFVEQPRRTVAVGATIRVANASVVRAGRVTKVHMPGGWLAPIQAVEYLRSFLLGRAGAVQVRGMLFVSGAFSIFRRDAFELAGGLDLDSEGDDVEVVADIHHRLMDARQPYLVDFVPDPACWTMVPDTFATLARQRRRWAQIMTEALWKHRAMMLNPRYGVMGMIVCPYYALFELGGGLVELLSLAVFIAGWALGVLSPVPVLLFLVVGYGYAIALSVTGVIVEELSYRRYGSWRDLLLLTYAAVAENLGYRQCYAWWRVRGITDAVLHRRAKWVTPGAASPGGPGGQDRDPAIVGG